MADIQVSVIVPVYNSEKHLREMLDSLIAQTKINLEFLIVNNGSSDSSGNIIEEYAEKDKRIKVITFGENKGVYGARNTAIEMAQGEYIAFADSDDYICPDSYYILYSTVIKYNTDVVIGGFSHVYDTGEIIRFSPKHTIGMFEPLMQGGAIWNKLYKRELLQRNHIIFPERNHMEDNVFLSRVYQCRPTIVIEDYDVYHYMQRMKEIDNRLTGSTYDSVMQSFESVKEVYSSNLPCNDHEVFECFCGALHYLRDLWINMGNLEEQKKTYTAFRETIFTMPWEGREEYFYWNFKILYCDFLQADYELFLSSTLRSDHKEILSLERRINQPETDIVAEKCGRGELGLKTILRFAKEWAKHKLKYAKENIKSKISKTKNAVKDRIRSITPFFILIVWMQYTYRGYRLYRSLQKTYGKDTHILLIPYEGTGDAYIAGCLLKSFIEKNKICKYVVLQPLSRGERVLNLFEIYDVKPISIDERNWISQFQLVCGKTANLIHVMHFHPCNHIDILNHVEGINSISFYEMYEAVGFSFANKSKPTIKEDCNKRALQELEKMGLKPDLTILLAPYAETIPSIPFDGWEYIARKLIEAGFSVCVNAPQNAPYAISGAHKIFYPYPETLALIDNIRAFIGVRSGLCDIISSSKCEKIIVYPQKFMWGCGRASSYFSINKLDSNAKVLEVEFDPNDWVGAANRVIARVLKGK